MVVRFTKAASLHGQVTKGRRVSCDMLSKEEDAFSNLDSGVFSNCCPNGRGADGVHRSCGQATIIVFACQGWGRNISLYRTQRQNFGIGTNSSSPLVHRTKQKTDSRGRFGIRAFEQAKGLDRILSSCQKTSGRPVIKSSNHHSPCDQLSFKGPLEHLL